MDLFLTPIRHAVSLLFGESSVSMDRDFIKGCFQCLEFCIGQLYVSGTEVFEDSSLVLGSRDRYYILIFRRYLNIS